MVVIAGIGAMAWSVLSPSMPWDPPPEVKAEQNPVVSTPQTLAEAKPIYDLRCAHCHGDLGNGDGPEAHRLSIQPTDFTDKLSMEKLTDAQLFWRIGAGRRPMPSFQNRLSEKERWELVNYIRQFSAPPPTSK